MTKRRENEKKEKKKRKEYMSDPPKDVKLPSFSKLVEEISETQSHQRSQHTSSEQQKSPYVSVQPQTQLQSHFVPSHSVSKSLPDYGIKRDEVSGASGWASQSYPEMFSFPAQPQPLTHKDENASILLPGKIPDLEPQYMKIQSPSINQPDYDLLMRLLWNLATATPDINKDLVALLQSYNDLVYGKFQLHPSLVGEKVLQGTFAHDNQTRFIPVTTFEQCLLMISSSVLDNLESKFKLNLQNLEALKTVRTSILNKDNQHHQHHHQQHQHHHQQHQQHQHQHQSSLPPGQNPSHVDTESITPLSPQSLFFGNNLHNKRYSHPFQTPMVSPQKKSKFHQSHPYHSSPSSPGNLHPIPTIQASNVKSSPTSSSPRRVQSQKILSCTHCGSNLTPEWRRGPDGDKSLCNACGLFYSKLIRKYHSPNIAGSIMNERKQNNVPYDRHV